LEEFFENELSKKFEEMIENNENFYFDSEEIEDLKSREDFEHDYFEAIDRKEIKKEKLEDLKKVKIVKKDLYEFNDDFIPEESEDEECQEKKK
jgi:hypothetical protein